MFKELDPRFFDSMGPSKAFLKGIPRRLLKTQLKRPKVFVIGFHKTGTSSLGKALQILGYDVCGSLKTGYAVQHSYHAVWEKAKELTAYYDGFQDTPWFLFYRKLYQLYPDAKFILTVRNEEKWLRSALNHFGTNHLQWHYHSLIYGKADAEKMKAIYQFHNANVRSFFKNMPENFLEINLNAEKNIWDKLCNLIGAKKPNVKFPFANKRLSKLL